MSPPSTPPLQPVESIPNLIMNIHHFPSPSASTTKTPIPITLSSVEKKTYYGEDVLLTGHSIWFGAINMISLLSEVVLSQSREVRPRDVLELGAGTGLAGIYYSLGLKAIEEGEGEGGGKGEEILRPVNIVLTDGEITCVETLKQNCELNDLRESTTTTLIPTTPSSNVNCSQLWWGPFHTSLTLSSILSTTTNASGFDLIIGADLIYDKLQVPVIHLLFQTVAAALAETGVFYLAFTRRNCPIEVVIEIARKYGLVCGVEDDYCWDIFNNNTDGMTGMWRDAIYWFRKGSDYIGDEDGGGGEEKGEGERVDDDDGL